MVDSLPIDLPTRELHYQTITAPYPQRMLDKGLWSPDPVVGEIAISVANVVSALLGLVLGGRIVGDGGDDRR